MLSIAKVRMTLAVYLAVVACGRAQAQQTLDTKVVEASLFKNGFGFVIREADLPGAGEYVLNNLPVPVHGSFWIIPESKSTTVKEAVAFNSPRGEMADALTLLDLLKANVGKKVEVRTEKDDWFAGTIVAVPQREPRMPASSNNGNASPNYGDYWGPPQAYRPPSAGTGQPDGTSGLVLLRGDQGQMVALSPSEIRGIRSTASKGGAGDLSLQVSRSLPGAALRLRVTGGGGRLRIACLEHGLTWAPSYQIDISDAKEASIRCKATIINDADEMQGTTVNFITGYPNLAFAEVVDPLALMGNVSDFLQSLIRLGAPSRRGRTPIVAQQAVMMNVSPGQGGPPSSAVPGEGEVREDLFLYPQSDVTLKRGERGYYPLFAKSVPYESLYQWEVDDSLDEQSRWRFAYWYDRSDQQIPEQEEVWHSLRLQNAGGIPWTTAPAMTVQEGRILGQDTLFYTSPGSKTMLKITRAVDIKAEQNEWEVDRQRGAKTAYSREYDLVTIKGELRAFNYKSKPVTMLIKKTLSGEVLENSPKADMETTTKGVWRVNPQQLLTWELPMEAAGKLYVTYRYRVYALR